VISGIPSWVQMYFEKLHQKEGSLYEILKNFNLFIYGGELRTYRAKFENLIGRKVDSIELFPASKDFCVPRFAKGKRNATAVELGIFYEFIVTSFILKILDDIRSAKQM
jgi:hypothetical protein